MLTSSRLSILLFCLVVAPQTRADDGKASPELAALQRSVEKTVADNEPSIACILVSRSKNYTKLEPPNKETPSPGRLGRFDVEFARRSRPEWDRVVKTLDLSSPDHVPEAYGSGVVIDESGLILTNAHVVKDATKIYVRLSANRGSWADIHASDPRSDLAVLRLLDKVPNLKPVKFGDGGKSRKGQFVTLLINPFNAGFRDGSPSAYWGLISNTLQRVKKPYTNGAHIPLNPLHQYDILWELDTRRISPAAAAACSTSMAR